MGLRNVRPERDNSDILALPYNLADVHAKEQENQLKRRYVPHVYPVPDSWTGKLLAAAFLAILLLR